MKISNIKLLVLLIILSLLVNVVLTGCEKSTINIGEVNIDEENTLLWNLSYDEPATWDPQLLTSTDGSDIARQLFEGLTVSSKNGFELGVAEDYEIKANSKGVDNTVYTFKLRKDAKWSDGKAVTAIDFENSFKRMCNPKTKAGYAHLFTSYIKGAEEYYNGEGNKEDIGIRALDEYTLEIELKMPVPYFLELLSMPCFYPVREDVINKSDWEKSSKTCISNGPYRLLEYIEGSHVLLVKNNHYYGKDDIQISNIKYLIGINYQEINSRYNEGNLDIIRIYPQGNVEKYKQSPDFFETNYLRTYFLVFNTDKKPVNNTNVRKAFSYAIDRKLLTYNQPFLRAAGFVSPALTLSDGKSFIEMVRNIPTSRFGININRAEVEKSKEILKEAGYANINDFPEIDLLCWNYAEYTANICADMLKENLGIKININAVEYNEYLKLTQEGDFTVAIANWGADYNDPMAMLELWTSYSAYNDANWSSKEYDEAIYNSMITVGKERDKFLVEAENILMEEMVIAPLTYEKSYYGINVNKIDGVELTPLGNIILRNAKFKK